MYETITKASHGGTSVAHVRAERILAHPQAAHAEHRLTFLVSGEVRLDAGGVVHIPGGSMTVVPAGAPHRSLGGSQAELWLLGFCGSCLGLQDDAPLMRQFGRVRRGALPVTLIHEERHQKVVQHFRDLADALSFGGEHTREVTRALVVLLLDELCRADDSPSNHQPSDTLVSQALAFIQAQALGSISLREVAAAVHRSPGHVATMVKEATGYTVGDWIRSARVAEAVSWLIHTDESLDDIAARVGWKDKTHFIRQFRKEHGITPAAWRRRERSADAEGHARR